MAPPPSVVSTSPPYPPSSHQQHQEQPPRTERDPAFQQYWLLATNNFNIRFYENKFGHACNVCDRIWFESDLRPCKPQFGFILEPHFGMSYKNFKLCFMCLTALKRDRLPQQSTVNGFAYPPKPDWLPPLDPLTRRLVSPRIPFMAIRKLSYDNSIGIIGQIINVPMDVDSMVSKLPRNLDDDYAINIAIKRRMTHKSSYLKGFVQKRVVKAWLSYLVDTPLYINQQIEIDWSDLACDSNDNQSQAQERARVMSESDVISRMDPDDNSPAQGPLLARQETLLWNENHFLEIAPHNNCKPLNIIFDRYCEELSFPDIYYGHERILHPRCGKVSYHTIANSEIRRKDRRGTKPEHILYMFMKLLRSRCVDGITRSFRRNFGDNMFITAAQIRSRAFLDHCIQNDFAFLKTIPNSAQYWRARRLDLSAMMRQLGKPTMFLTLSANEQNWPELLKILHRLGDNFHDINIVDPLIDLNRSQRAHLVNNDPAVCCAYFNKMVDTIMTMLKKTSLANPFGRYQVLDFFMRIEFQHRGSPHAHIVLWLANDPKEASSENMPKSIELMTDLLSVSRDDVGDEIYANQIHRHTFTCARRGENTCRFNIPYWPIDETRILYGLAQDNPHRSRLARVGKRAKNLLQTKVYNRMDDFWIDLGITTIEQYLDIIRSTLSRPTVVFKRDFTQIMTNTFNPWLAKIVNSNTDLQFVIDERSCANYMLDYVNKASRGTGNLHKELLKLRESFPEFTSDQLMSKLASTVINTIEVSSQEAAWYLLRQNMSVSSRHIQFIPTFPPSERFRSHKTGQALKALHPDSIDVWTKNIIDHYEKRPIELNEICLADFASYWSMRSKVGPRDHVDSMQGDDDDDDGDGDPMDVDNDDNVDAKLFQFLDHNQDDQQVNSHGDNQINNIDNIDNNNNNNNNNNNEPLQPLLHRSYVKRREQRVIRYCNYDQSDLSNYKRELCLLFLPFRNETIEINDRDRFETLFDENIDLISAKKAEYEKFSNLDQIVEELSLAQALDGGDNNTRRLLDNRARTFDRFAKGIQHSDAIDSVPRLHPMRNGAISQVQLMDNIMSKEDYCKAMRTTNKLQREIILEVIHRLQCKNENVPHEPIQIFFTGSAGCGKTYVLKLIMDSINRFSFSNQVNILNNNYLACASTGKAAVSLGGMTVHSAFTISQSKESSALSTETLQKCRELFVGVNYVIVDEVSMIGNALLQKMNKRLQQIFGNHEKLFAGMPIIFCGDLRQLPPVQAAAVYKSTRNHIQAPIWQQLDYFKLDQVVRQSDKILSNLLTKLGNGEPLTMHESSIIEGRFRYENWCDENLPNATRLFFRNSDVVSYNYRMLRPDCYEHKTKDTYIGYRNNDELRHARSNCHRLNYSKTAGLPYQVKLQTGIPYMVTTNVNVMDGVVNGSIGQLKYFKVFSSAQLKSLYSQNRSQSSQPIASRFNLISSEGDFMWRSIPNLNGQNDDDDDNNSDIDNDEPEDCAVVWLDLGQDGDKVGAIEREQNKHLLKYAVEGSGESIDVVSKWTPISEKSASIPGLFGTVRCRRRQLPLVPACAITIHKSQGATFKEAVISYEKELSTPLVYVALSRLQDISGLYLINRKHDFRFYHKYGSTNPSIEEVRTEYRRLENHPLKTLTKSIEQFIQFDNLEYMQIGTINSQSLNAHREDISTDPILSRLQLLCITETWMPDGQVPFVIDGFECIVDSNNKDRAGGVALYRSLSIPCTVANCIRTINLRDAIKDVTQNFGGRNQVVGDVCCAEIQLHPNTSTVWICTVYMKVHSNQESLKQFFHKIIAQISTSASASSTQEQDQRIKLILTGDFNVDVDRHEWLVAFMNNELDLHRVASSSSYGTTLAGTSIDLVFTRNLTSCECHPFVCYFSHHRPLISRLSP